MKIKLRCLDCGEIYKFIRCIPGLQRCPKCDSARWKRYSELEALLNNCVDDDEAILYRRELEGLEEVNTNG